MTKNLKVFFIIVMYAGLTPSLMSQVFQTTGVSAEIFRSVAITETHPSRSGITLSPSGSSIVVLPNTTSLNSFSSENMTAKDQQKDLYIVTYKIAGIADAAYTINLPADSIVTLSDGLSVNDMSVTKFRAHSTSSGVERYAGALDKSGEDSITIGGTLHLRAFQKPGIYYGRFNVTIIYN
jgi:hypothetical protein